jgi:hypothetical protein
MPRWEQTGTCECCGGLAWVMPDTKYPYPTGRRGVPTRTRCDECRRRCNWSSRNKAEFLCHLKKAVV